MATLQNKAVVVIGGSSGIGFGVALAALQSLASMVIIASSKKPRIEDAVSRLKAHKLPGEVRGDVLDVTDTKTVKAFALGLGAVDHVVWTSGDVPKEDQGSGKWPYSNVQSVEKGQGIFSVRFWGPFILANHVKFNSGGSMTLTSGMAGQKPFPGCALASSLTAAIEGLTRGLAVDFAPTRVNVICPGLINTEITEKLFGERKEEIINSYNEKFILKRGREPSEIAEAYIFLMKCGYVTGQRINTEGGFLLL